MGGGTVFVSYRRQLSWALALLVFRNLTRHGFDVFIDSEGIDSGEVERVILRQIEQREHFVVLLQPGSLDRIGEEGDWLRREIAHALACDRNVVPVTADGFEFRRDLVLPADVARLPRFNAVSIPPGYFDAAMDQLRSRFLKMSSTPISPPLSETRNVADPVQPALARPGAGMAAGALVQPAPRLTGLQDRKNVLRVGLTWTDVSGAHEYVLERAGGWAPPGAAPEFREVYRGPGHVYNDVPATSTGYQSWRYRVRAGISGKAGSWSEPVEVYTGFQ
jgi:hypothetical protein